MIPIAWNLKNSARDVERKLYIARRSNAMTQVPQKVRFKFFRDIYAELKKVTWPTWRQASYLTTVVVLTCLVVGGLLGAIDLGFTKVAGWLTN